MKRTMVKWSLILSVAVSVLAPALVRSQGVTLSLNRYPNVGSASEVVSNWSKDQHLYVKGDLGIGSQQLDGLERWLDQNAPHWTVVLMRDARGESYQSLDRRSFLGMDAVEYALGRGLALRTGFSDLIDSRTGETDGAVFVLFLEERKFSYYASVAQDVRSLGESHWVGELDRPAFRAMRGGGRIIDAVRDTITNINNRLTRKIEAEREQAERELRARQRAFVNLKTDIAALRQSIAEADKKAAAMQASLPEATGELTAPPTETWRRQLEEAEGMLTETNVPLTADKFQEVANEVEGFLNSYAEYETFDGAIAPIESDIDALKSSALKSGRPMAEEASANLTAAREARSKAERGLSVHLNKARDAVARGQDAVAAEQAQLERDAARKKVIWRTIMITAAILSLAFLGVLAWLNRRRAPAMKRAHEKLAEREQSVEQEMDKVYELFDSHGRNPRRQGEGTETRLHRHH